MGGGAKILPAWHCHDSQLTYNNRNKKYAFHICGEISFRDLKTGPWHQFSRWTNFGRDVLFLAHAYPVQFSDGATNRRSCKLATISVLNLKAFHRVLFLPYRRQLAFFIKEALSHLTLFGTLSSYKTQNLLRKNGFNQLSLNLSVVWVWNRHF